MINVKKCINKIKNVIKIITENKIFIDNKKIIH